MEVANPDRLKERLKLYLAHMREESNPVRAQRLQWFLLTSLAMGIQAEANPVLDWNGLH